MMPHIGDSSVARRGCNGAANAAGIQATPSSRSTSKARCYAQMRSQLFCDPRARPSRARAARCPRRAARCGPRRSPRARALSLLDDVPDRACSRRAASRSARTLTSRCGKRAHESSPPRPAARGCAVERGEQQHRRDRGRRRSSGGRARSRGPTARRRARRRARRIPRARSGRRRRSRRSRCRARCMARWKPRFDIDVTTTLSPGSAAGDLQVAREDRDDLVAVDDRAGGVDARARGRRRRRTRCRGRSRPSRTRCGERVEVRRAALLVDVDAVGVARP